MSVFLDRLAMEVSEWAGTPGDEIWCWAHSNAHDDFIAYERDDSFVTKPQWLQRRKELINEPEDCDAPEWVEWVAQDATGRWNFYEDKPFASKTQWYSYNPRVALASSGLIPVGHDWRNTLRKVERKICNDVDTSELPHCFGVDAGAEENSPASIQELCILIDTTDDHIARLMLQATLAQVLEREYGVDLSND